MFKRILIVATSIALVTAMVGAFANTSMAQQTCPDGFEPPTQDIISRLPGPGCVQLNPIGPEGPGTSCPEGSTYIGPYIPLPSPTNPVPLPPQDICFAPYEEVDPTPEVTKEACKEDFVALGFENQGQCVKAANEAAQSAG